MCPAGGLLRAAAALDGAGHDSVLGRRASGASPIARPLEPSPLPASSSRCHGRPGRGLRASFADSASAAAVSRLRSGAAFVEAEWPSAGGPATRRRRHSATTALGASFLSVAEAAEEEASEAKAVATMTEAQLRRIVEKSNKAAADALAAAQVAVWTEAIAAIGTVAAVLASYIGWKMDDSELPPEYQVPCGLDLPPELLQRPPASPPPPPRPAPPVSPLAGAGAAVAGAASAVAASAEAAVQSLAAAAGPMRPASRLSAAASSRPSGAPGTEPSSGAGSPKAAPPMTMSPTGPPYAPMAPQASAATDLASRRSSQASSMLFRDDETALH